MPRRDAQAPRQDSATASIKGRVVALDTGAPLRHVQLRLSGAGMRQPRAVLSDAQGMYEFKDLPASRYMITASKGGFVTLQYGQRGPKDMGRFIELADKQTLDKIDLALPRGAVITGRVVDETGEAVSDVSVMALQYRTMAGKRRLVPMNGGRGGGATNDIGQFRIYGLPPGEYYLAASGRLGQMSMDMQSDDGSGYAMTYYPGTPSLADAQRVTIGIGEETAVDIQLIPTKVSRITGNVVTASGKPATAGMAMLQMRGGEMIGVMNNAAMGAVRPDGTFTINGVAVGAYQLSVMAYTGDGSPSADSMERASVAVTVTGQDINDLRVVTGTGVTISGHVTFEGGTPDTKSAAQLQAICSPVEMENVPFGSQPSHIADDGTFEIKGITSACMVNAFGLGQGWTMKSAMLNGVDLTERPFEPAGRSIAGLELTLTNRVTTITGSVQTTQDQAANDYTVVIFPEDNQKWQGPLSGRYLRRARPDQTGTFKLQGLPPSRYFVVAFEHIDEGQEMDPEFLTRIRSQATHLELIEGATQTVSLKLGNPGS